LDRRLGKIISIIKGNLGKKHIYIVISKK